MDAVSKDIVIFSTPSPQKDIPAGEPYMVERVVDRTGEWLVAQPLRYSLGGTGYCGGSEHKLDSGESEVIGNLHDNPELMDQAFISIVSMFDWGAEYGWRDGWKKALESRQSLP